MPLLNPAQFRRRLQLNSTTGEKFLHPALVATVLAWGSKFSEHPLLVSDRKRPGGQSLLAKALVDRARDLAEALKVHRVSSADHVVICLLIEPLQSRQFPFLVISNLQLMFLYRKSGRSQRCFFFFSICPCANLTP